MYEAEEDDRVKREGICGVTRIGPSGIEWICVKQVHGKVYERKTSGRTYKKGDPIFSESMSNFQHYFVNRWPNRKDRGAQSEEADR